MLKLVRKASSILIITLLLIAYGRCIADQYGALHTTESACCQTTCDTETHCSDEVSDNSAEAPVSEHKDSKPNDEESPSPCLLCFILDSEGMPIASGVKVPHPVYSELISHVDFVTDTPPCSGRLLGEFPHTDLPIGAPDSPEEPSSLFRCSALKATPVRGPAIVS